MFSLNNRKRLCRQQKLYRIWDESSLKFINKVFKNLNDFQDKHNISHETNEALSNQIINLFSGGAIWKEE